MRPYYILLLAVIFVSQVNAQSRSEAVTVGSLNEVINAAVQHNPTQAVYQQQIRQAKYNYKASQGAFYPNASAGFSGTDNLHLATTPVPGELIGKPGETIYLQFGKHYSYNTGITLTQNIFDWSVILQSKIARNNIQLNEVEQDAYVQSLKEQVARLYYSALIAKSALHINQLDKLLADTLQQLADQRLKEGSSDLISKNQAVINYNSVIQNQVQTQQLYDQSIENLKILLGTDPDLELNLLEKLDLDSVAAVNNQLLGPDKGLGVYKQQVLIADIQSKAQRSVAYPKIAANAYFGDQQFRDDFGLSFGNGAWSGVSYVGLSINVPIFTGLSNSYKYKSSKVQKDIAQLNFDNAQQQSAINDRLLLKNYNDYLGMVISSSASFSLYGINLRLSQQKYKEGVITMDVYLKAFQDYLAAENGYLNNLSLLLSSKSTIISRQ